MVARVEVAVGSGTAPLWDSSIGRRRHFNVLIVCLVLLDIARASGAVHGSSDPVASLPKITLQELAGAATLSGVVISPNGRFVSVRVARNRLSTNTVSLRWYILGIRDGRVAAEADGGDPYWLPNGRVDADSPQWSRNSEWLYFRRLAKGARGLYRLSLHGDVEAVVSSGSDVDSFIVDNGQHGVFYTVGPSRQALRAAERSEYERGVILNGTQYIGAPLENNWPDGAGMASVRLRRNGIRYGWYVVGDSGARTLMVTDMETGKSHLADPEEAIEYESLTRPCEAESAKHCLSWARSDRTGEVAFVRYRDPSARDSFGHHNSAFDLGVAESNGSQVHWCRAEECRDLTPWVIARPGTAEFMFTTATQSGFVRMLAWNVTDPSPRVIFEVRGMIGPNGSDVFSSQCPVNAQYAVCVVERADDPPMLSTIDLDDGTFRRLFDPNASLRGELLRSGIPLYLKYFTWRDDRGLEHSGEFLRARTSGARRPPPLVITSYSCNGFLRGGTGATTPEFVLWEDGFSVLCTNADDASEAPNYTSPAIPSGQSARMQYMYDGWLSAVRSLSRGGLVDAHRVGISGLSFTAEVVNYVVTHYPTFAAAATAGHLDATDPLDFYINAGMNGSSNGGYGLQDPRTTGGAQYYRQVSDAVRASNVRTPLLIQTDEGEFQDGLEYLGALRFAQAPAEVIIFPNETHLFWQPVHQLLVEDRNIDWFRFWLQDYRSPDPSARERYTRWEKIRAGIRDAPGPH